MIHSSRQLKDLVRNMSEKTGVEAHVLIRKYMMERFLERMSLSKYRDNFVLKGGLLVSAFVGTQIRTTMDIDTTIHGLSISEKSMTQIIEEICAIPLDDNVRFEVKNVSTIMDGAEYGGIRFSMEAFLDNSVTPLKIDISTGDIITPCEILYSYKLMFEDQDIAIMVYPIETVLAEKIETVIARSTTNTRMRDFYDIHVLLNSPKQVINQAVLSRALTATTLFRFFGKDIKRKTRTPKTIHGRKL